jgi:hypothetical protein
MPKILLACPVSDYKEYILFEWLHHLKTLDGFFDIFLVDNSYTPDLAIKLKKAGYNIIGVMPDKNDVKKVRTMAKCMEIIRNYALINNYDYLFSLECDVFPPKDIIARLLEINNPAAGATYFIDSGPFSRLMVQRTEPETLAGESIVRNLTIDESFLFCDGTVKFAFGIGLGCVLIHKSILTRVKFRYEPGSLVHADSYFYRDLYNLKQPVKVHTGIICTHINQDWGEIARKQKSINQ